MLRIKTAAFLSPPFAAVEDAPGVLFYFNAGDVVGATANTWNDRTGNYKADIFNGNLSTPYSLPFNNTPTGTVKCAYFQNLGTALVRKVAGNAPPYPITTTFPSAWWAAVVASSDNGNSAQRSYFSSQYSVETLNRFMTIDCQAGYNFGQARYENYLITRVGDGSTWGDAQQNVATNGQTGSQGWLPCARLNLYILQGGASGLCRVNGTPFMWRANSAGAKTFAPTGGTVAGTDGYFTIGSRAFVANTIITGGVRAAAFGEGSLSQADIERLEGILAHDALIHTFLPPDHPYYAYPPV